MRGSKLVAWQALYNSDDRCITWNNWALIKIDLAIAVREGTYGGIGPTGGLTTEGISVDAGVVNTDYRGEIKVQIVTHGTIAYEVRKGARIAQLLVERLDDQEWVQADRLDENERAEKGFGSSGICTELKEVQPTIDFLQADGNYQLNDPFDIDYHSILSKGKVHLSKAIITKVTLQKFEEDFVTSVKEMAKENENWIQRKEKLETLLQQGKELLK